MIPSPGSTTPPHDEAAMERVLAAYLAAEERGEMPAGGPRAVIAAHPHLAAGLREFFADRAGFRHLAAWALGALHPGSCVTPPESLPKAGRPSDRPPP